MTPRHHFLKIISRLSIFLSVMLLSGCYLSASTNTGHNSLSVSGKSLLSINERIDVKPGYTRVFIQDGIVVSQFNHYHPSCNIEVRKKDNENWQYIHPADYQVVSSQQTMEEIVLFNPGSEVRVASLWKISDLDGGPSDIYRGMHFYLSGQDSNVMRLSCRGGMDSPHEARLPTMNEIQQVLGKIMHLKL